MARRSSTIPPFPEHLRYLVRPSGNSKTVTQVICGPVGSGKTTLVNSRRSSGDLIVDVDALFVALSGEPWFETSEILLPFVLDARDAVLDRIALGDVGCRAWVITSQGNMTKVLELANRLRAAIVVLAVPSTVCEQRIRGDSLRRPEKLHTLYIPLINAWWDDYEQSRHVLPPNTEIRT